jgi:Kef-type K+ transport system membrane component KefB
LVPSTEYLSVTTAALHPTPAAAAVTAPHLLLAVVVVCAAAYAAGAAMAMLGQPRAIGEIAAGILLGPTLLGAVAPGAFSFLFHGSMLPDLNWLARLGVIFFVFFIGAEFETELVRTRWRLVGSLAAGSLFVPLVLGIALGFPLCERLSVDSAHRGAFVLFLGVSTAITAFPVLAAILEAVGLVDQPIGRLALGTAALTDVAAWCLLALVAAAAGSGNDTTAAERLLGALGIAAAALVVLRPIWRWALRAVPLPVARVARPVGGLALAVGLASATEHVGVTVIFGSLIAGVAFGPEPGETGGSLERFKWLNRIALLPIFFAATGLRIDLRSSGSAMLIAAGAAVLLVGSAGKLAGVCAAARAWALPWRESVSLGILLNTKGLTELVVLRLGYDLGLLSQNAFGVLVVAALLSTAATVPALALTGAIPARARAAPAEAA